jgi:integrase
LSLYWGDDDDLSGLAELPYAPDPPVVTPVFRDLLGGDTKIYYGDFKNDLVPVLKFRIGGVLRRDYGTDDSEIGIDPFEFCEQASKELAGSNERQFDGDVPEFIAWFIRTYAEEVAAEKRWAALQAQATLSGLPDDYLKNAYLKSLEEEPLLGKCECRKSRKKRLAMKPEGTGNNWTCRRCGYLHKEKPRSGKPADRSTLALIDSLPKGTDRRAALMLMWRAGLRLHEALALKWADLLVDPTKGIYIAHGKGDKARFVPMAPDLKKELLALLKSRDGTATSNDRVIEMKREALQQWMRRHNACCHSARHSFGFEVTAKTDIYKTAVLMGHSSIRTTMGYAHADPADIAKALGWQE